MRKFIYTLAGILSFTLLTSFSEETAPISTEEIQKTPYCEGWEDGYCEGWKDVKGKYAICPVTPICPIAEIGKTSYKDGYNRGFKAGMKAARK